MQKTIQNLKWLTLSAVLGIAIGGGLIAVNAWTEPTVAPPGGNIGAPINTSATGQSKSGGLLLNTVGATNGLIVQSGNVGIGVINPNAKFHVLGNTFLEGGENGVYGQLNIRTSGIADHDAQLAFTTAKNSRGLYIDDSDSNKMKFYTGYGKGIAGKEVTFDNEGSVGIGTTSPSTGLRLDVEGKVGATEYCDQDGNNCKAITAMGGSGLGVGQAWTNVLSQRSNGATYTNNTGKPVEVIVTVTNTFSTASAKVNGLQIVTIARISPDSVIPITFTVPAGATYSVAWSGTCVGWFELR